MKYLLCHTDGFMQMSGRQFCTAGNKYPIVKEDIAYYYIKDDAEDKHSFSKDRRDDTTHVKWFTYVEEEELIMRGGENTMTVRVKVYLAEKAECGWPHTKVKSTKLTFYPVTGGSEENKAFFQATPSGKIEFATVNDQVAPQFESGKEYYFDITPAN